MTTYAITHPEHGRVRAAALYEDIIVTLDRRAPGPDEHWELQESGEIKSVEIGGFVWGENPLIVGLRPLFPKFRLEPTNDKLFKLKNIEDDRVWTVIDQSKLALQPDDDSPEQMFRVEKV